MIAFLSQTLKRYHTTGAIAPSSVPLARAMTDPLRHRSGSVRVLEVGPGTGAFTRQVLTLLKPGDEFHLVEINPDFAHQLESGILETYRTDHPGVEVHMHQTSIQDVVLAGGFDFIVCGLPFNNFPLHMVSLIFRRMMSLLRDGGELTYFEYLGMKAVKWPWVGSRGRQRLRRRIAMAKVLERRHAGRRDLVVRNITPAHAIHLTAK